MRCGKHGNAQRNKKKSPIVVAELNELCGADFVGSFPEMILTKEEAFRCSWPQLYENVAGSELSQYGNLKDDLS